MISIIPKPYKLIDCDKTISKKGFKINCPMEIIDGLKIFKNEFTDYLSGDFQLNVTLRKFNNPDAYNLKVMQNEIIIECSNERSLFYATRSLKQIINIKNNKLVISVCEIYDKPKYLFRSFSLDESRHFFGIDEVKKILDILSLLKIRYFHWHLSDDQGFRIKLKKFLKLFEIGSKRSRTQIINDYGNCYDDTPYQAAYEEEEIIDIIQYAKERFISIIPEIDVPGHTASIVASYPFLHCFDKEIDVYTRACGNYDIICPSKETTYKFLDELFAEVMILFKDSEYIHIGGDEVNPSNWKLCLHCKKKMQELNMTDASQLQGYFSNRFINILKKYNKKIIMWHNGIKDNTDPNIILQYWTWKMEEEAINRINNGRDTIYSPCSQLYFDAAYAELPLKRTYGRGIKLTGLNQSGRNNIFGMECCSWNEFVRDKDFLEFMIFPRIHAFSESAWSYIKKLDYSDFKLRLEYHLNLLDQLGIKYCPLNIADNDDKEEIISPIFRKYNRYIEYNHNF